jgi:hypothetical protein
MDSLKIDSELRKHYGLEHLEDKKIACDSCRNFKNFGKACWYFWELKKECSQKTE